MRYKAGQPSADVLTQLALDILKVWKRLGRALGLVETSLDDIAADVHGVYEQALAMLRIWTQVNGSQATYSKLAEGLLHPTLEHGDLVLRYCVDREQEEAESRGAPVDEALLREMHDFSMDDVEVPSITILPGQPFHKTYQRRNELQKIDTLYRSIERQDDVTTVYLSGPPGSGKSQLSRQYGEWYGERQSDACVVVATLHAETHESLLESYKQLSCALGLRIPDKYDDVGKKLELYASAVKACLCQSTNDTFYWLLIVDNVVASEPLKMFWPCPDGGWGGGRVLVTTQDSELAPTASEHVRKLSLSDGMDEEDAVNLLCLISDLQRDNITLDVARKLNCYPLSLACAAVFIKEMREERPVANFTWRNYLFNLEKYFEILEYSEFKEQNLCYPRSMLPAAFCAARRMAENNELLAATFRFLSHCALQPVPLDVVAEFVLCACAGKPQIPDVVKRKIANCSLLMYPRSGARGMEVITMHQVMRAAFVQLRKESCKAAVEAVNDGQATMELRERKAFEDALETMNDCYQRHKTSMDEQGISIRILLSPHLQTAVDVAQSNTWSNSEIFVDGSVCLADSLVHVAGATDTHRVSILERAYEIQKVLGLKNLAACRLMSDLGYTYREAGKLDKVFPVLEEANVIAESQEGAEWMKERSHILNILAWTYRESYQLDLAAAYMQMCVDVTKEGYGSRHTEVIERLCNLGIILHDGWDNLQALQVLGEARELVESLQNTSHGAIHAQVLNYTAKVHLRWFLGLIHTEGMTERTAAHLQRSKLLHEQALAIYEHLHGKKHKFYAGTLMTYGMVLRHDGDLERAHAHCAAAVIIYRASSHIAWPRAATWLADIHLARREFDAAKTILEEILRAHQELGLTISPGAFHPRALLAEAMVETGHREEGMRILRECLAEWQEKGLHPEHYWVVRSRNYLATYDNEYPAAPL